MLRGQDVVTQGVVSDFRQSHKAIVVAVLRQTVVEAIALQANNKVKLLYGVRTSDEGKQYQVIATRGDFILRNTASVNAYAKLEKSLTDAKLNGAFATTEFKVQELKEYTVEATNLEKPVEEVSEMPWDDN